jgi:acetyl-CoA acetyltransferase
VKEAVVADAIRAAAAGRASGVKDGTAAVLWTRARSAATPAGARVFTTSVYETKRRNVRYGPVTMCIGVGQGIATIVERA